MVRAYLIRRRIGWIVAAQVLALLAGCKNAWLDPSQVGRFAAKPVTLEIRDSLGVDDESPYEFAEASEPTPEDLQVPEEDYRIAPGDILQISVIGLVQPDVESTFTRRVSETGYIGLPYVGRAIHMEGLTEREAEAKLMEILRDTILKNPKVSVAVVQRTQQQFTVLGAVAKPNTYILPRPDFRLLQAIGLAEGAPLFNVEWIYVLRYETEQAEQPPPLQPVEPKVPIEGLEQGPAEGPNSQQPSGNTSQPTKPDDVQQQLRDAVRPYSDGRRNGGEGEAVLLGSDAAGGKVNVQLQQLQKAGEPPRIKFVLKNGKWVPVSAEPAEQKGQQPGPAESAPPGSPRSKQAPAGPSSQPAKPVLEPFDWRQYVQAGPKVRVIAIPWKRLYAGDPRYNIVIRPNDTIMIPFERIGEFYVMGNVYRPGVYGLTGRKITLKQAIAAAGGLNGLAWPSRCEIIRRIDSNHEEIVRVDLEKLYAGEQPDIFIKDNDLINVGTSHISPFLAVLRNAFRATYGFGFVIDRNFDVEVLGKQPYRYK